MTSVTFDAAAATLRQQLSELSFSPEQLVVAFSGGVDSTFLLLLARQVAQDKGLPLSAVYINHGLSPNADAWQTHCEQICRSLDIPFAGIRVTVNPVPRQSTEAVARRVRYQALLSYCRDHNGVLLLGHHLQDQLETLLLQLKRGAGPRGLAGMGSMQERDGVMLLRPLLTFSKDQLMDVVRAYSLDWIEDESNQDTQFDRNFLRTHILPVLEQRWPHIAKTASRSAALCAEQSALIEEEAQQRLERIKEAGQSLCIAGLQQYSEGWQRAVLRCWLEQAGGRLPSQVQLEEVRSVMSARNDAQPLVRLGKIEVRRFEQRLYVVRATPPDVPVRLSIPMEKTVSLPWLNAMLTIRLPDASAEKQWRITTGMPSVNLKPEGKAHSRPLKKWLKEWGIPPWERGEAGLLYCNEVPVAVLLPEKMIPLAGCDSSQIDYQVKV